MKGFNLIFLHLSDIGINFFQAFLGVFILMCCCAIFNNTKLGKKFMKNVNKKV